MPNSDHWEKVYKTKNTDEVSWFLPKPTLSLDLIKKLSVNLDDFIIDIGAGASNLVDELITSNFKNVSIMDISQTALEHTKNRLKDKGSKIEFLVGDITKITLPKNKYNIWHDRAVFHFLTQQEQRNDYIAQLKSSLAKNSNIIIATFSKSGPQKCSGLDVIRYDPKSLSEELGSDFELIEYVHESHETPSGNIQDFVYCNFKFKG